METLECPLTCEKMRHPVIMPCGHTFERESITEWVRKNGSCPTCRAPIPKESNFIPNLVVKSLLAAPVKEDFAIEGRCVGATLTIEPPSTVLEGSAGLFGSPLIQTLATKVEANPDPVPSPAAMDSASEYEEIFEEVSEPNSPVVPIARPEATGWSFAAPKQKRFGINPFTGEFEEEGDESGNELVVPEAGGMIQPKKKEKRRISKWVKKAKAPKPEPKQEPKEEPKEEPVPVSDAPASPQAAIPLLEVEITIHNLNFTTSIPSSQVVIDETSISWKGVAEVPEIKAQQSVRVQVILKLKANTRPSSAGWEGYTVEYRQQKQSFDFDVSLFANVVAMATPRTPSLENFNILLFGVAGSGKSSFVNKLATLLEGSKIPTSAFAPSGGGEKHVTKKLVGYRMPKSHVTLWDTWGYNGNYKDETLAYLFEGRLPSNWQMGDMKEPLLDSATGKVVGTRAQLLEGGTDTAYQRRIHAAILVISIDDLEDPYQCAAIAEKFHVFKEFSPILIINKVDKPFTTINESPSYFSWLKPWMPPVVTNAVVSVAKVSATAASAAAVWVGNTALNAHAGYKEKGWEGIVQHTFAPAPTAGPQPEEPNDDAAVEDSRPRLAEQQHFEVITNEEAHTSLPFWADSSHPVTKIIKRVASERCYVNPSSIFLNVNYVDQSSRNMLMDLQAYTIVEEVMRRAQLFEARYGAPNATLPHEIKTKGSGGQQLDWKWS